MKRKSALLLVVLTLAGCAAPATGSGPSAPVEASAPAPDASTVTESAPVAGSPAPAAVAPPPTLAGAAGIAGMTVVDGCPVMRDPPCPDKPTPATLSILDSSGKQIATVTSGTDGRFSVVLSPGRYTLRVGSAGASVTATVAAGAYTVLTIHLPSGIR